MPDDDPSSQTICIYTDGACSGNPGPGGWAAIVADPVHNRVKELAGGEQRTTNNRMELRAALEALMLVKDRPEPAHVCTDSTYLISGVTKWTAGWKRKGWLTAAGEPVLNRDLWEALGALAAARRGRLEWRHVRGHQGHDANERCDELAVAFSRGQRPALYDGPWVGYDVTLMMPDAVSGKLPERKTDAFRKNGGAKKGGTYLSLLDGQLMRHATWPECQARVSGKSGARFKKVSGPEEEAATLRSWGLPG